MNDILKAFNEPTKEELAGIAELMRKRAKNNNSKSVHIKGVIPGGNNGMFKDDRGRVYMTSTEGTRCVKGREKKKKRNLKAK